MRKAATQEQPGGKGIGPPGARQTPRFPRKATPRRTVSRSGRRDLHPRPQRPERCALPSCATSRARSVAAQAPPGARRVASAPVRIAQLCPPWLAVPPKGYGGIEWVVALLADGLADAGHDVTLFATGDSQTRARLEYVFEQAPGSRYINDIVLDTTQTLSALRDAPARFDVL